jgi:uncharacterized protein DUF4331
MRTKAVLALVVAAASALALTLALTRGPAPEPTKAASHREAPLISQDQTADVTDFYAFVSPDDPDMVTLIADWIPFEEPSAGPNWYGFSKNARYEIKIDNTGDAKPDITYRFEFRDNPNASFGPLGCIGGTCQLGTLTKIEHGRATVLNRNLVVGPNNIGPKFTPNYQSIFNSQIKPLSRGGKVFTGQADDPFFGDIAAAFDSVTIRPFPSSTGQNGGGIDSFAGFNVHVTALQLPISDVKGDGDVIGAWAASYRPASFVGGQGHGWVQVARLANPLTNELLIGTTMKDKWNRTAPNNDAQFNAFLTDPLLAPVINNLFGLQIPTTGRTDLKAIFHTGLPNLNQFGTVDSDMLRLNLAIPPAADPNRLTVAANDTAGWPNGRRLIDDVIDLAENGLEGAFFTPQYWPVVLGDGVNGNDMPYRSTFPYVALPHQGFANSHGDPQPTTP